MICSACHTVYPASEQELGKVDSLAGLCEKCGSKPHFMPFAVAYTEAAVSGLLGIEFVMLAWLSGSIHAALWVAGCVLAACAAMLLYARRSSVVRYANEREKRADTWPHRLLGLAFGLATVAAVFAIILSTGI